MTKHEVTYVIITLLTRLAKRLAAPRTVLILGIVKITPHFKLNT